MEEEATLNVYKLMNKKIILLVAALLLIAGSVIFTLNKFESKQGTGEEPVTPISDERGGDNGTTTLLFVGDIMLDRGTRNAIERTGDTSYPFPEEIKTLLGSADILVGNLEGTLTSNKSVAQSNNGILRFTFNKEWAEMLKGIGFDGVSLANNHALDFGADGLAETRQTLDKYGIFHFGSPLNSSELSRVIERSREKYCFVGYHALFDPNTEQVIAEIEKLGPECNYLVVFAHWGDEYKDYENETQRQIGRAFIDAGADLVIGHHPHVVEPVEIYKGRAIFYSLGNFVFDQDFSLPTRQGLAVRLELTDNLQYFHLIPVEMSRAKLYFPEKEAYRDRMNILISSLPEELKTTADVDSIFTLPRVGN